MLWKASGIAMPIAIAIAITRLRAVECCNVPVLPLGFEMNSQKALVILIK